MASTSDANQLDTLEGNALEQRRFLRFGQRVWNTQPEGGVGLGASP